MSDKNADLLVTIITSALSRVRAIMFVNLAICAIILTNIYVENWAFDRMQLNYFYYFQEEYDGHLKKIKMCLRDKDKCDPSLAGETDENLRVQESAVRHQHSFVKNSLKSVKLSSTDIPILGLRIPSNDLNIVCGLFMIVLSIWLVLYYIQIDNILSDSSVHSSLQDYRLGLQHSFLTVYSGSHASIKSMAIAILIAPAFVMGLSFLNNSLDVFGLIGGETILGRRQPMIKFMVTRLLVELAISLVLAWAAFVAVQQWRKFHKEFGTAEPENAR